MEIQKVEWCANRQGLELVGLGGGGGDGRELVGRLRQRALGVIGIGSHRVSELREWNQYVIGR